MTWNAGRLAPMTVSICSPANAVTTRTASTVSVTTRAFVAPRSTGRRADIDRHGEKRIEDRQQGHDEAYVVAQVGKLVHMPHSGTDLA